MRRLFLSVIARGAAPRWNEVKDLMAVASPIAGGDEILRCAQDDNEELH